MPAPPLRTVMSSPYPNPSGDDARAWFLANYDYFVALLGATGNPAEARTALGVPSIADVQNQIPAGTVIHVAMNTAPTGYLKANGQLVNRLTYASLFSAIGTTYGVGDGSTTFALPDLRGEFIRSLDDGRGVDTARGIGTFQANLVGQHDHYDILYANVSGPGNEPSNNVSQYVTDEIGTSTIKGVSNTGTGIGTETRPRNVALLACIKF